MGQTVRAVASSMRGVKNRPDEFMEMNNFIETFSQKINLIDKISQRIYKEERGMSLETEHPDVHLFLIYTLAAVVWCGDTVRILLTHNGSCPDIHCKGLRNQGVGSGLKVLGLLSDMRT